MLWLQAIQFKDPLQKMQEARIKEITLFEGFDNQFPIHREAADEKKEFNLKASAVKETGDKLVSVG